MGGLPDYDDWDGTEMALRVRRGDVHPRELLEACLERIERRNPRLGAVVHLDVDRARARAAASPPGAFGGVPFLLKDLKGEDGGQPSTASSRFLADHVAGADCELVRRIKAAGFNIVGRTNTPEFGIYAVTESELRGPCRNPWDLGRTPGGSSGGAAAAVAARIVPMAHGGDGGGSIRIPAAHCGLFGLKPTRARTPMGPFVGEGWGGLVCEHVLTRSVRDSARMLDVTRGTDLGAPYEVRSPAEPYEEVLARPPRPLRIAYTGRALFGDETHPACLAALEQGATLAADLGHEVEEACPAFDKSALVQAYLLTVAAGVAATLRAAEAQVGRRATPRDVELSTWMLKRIGETLSAADYVAARETIHREARRVARFFDTYDVLLTPTAAQPPVEIGAFALGRSDRLLIRLLDRVPLRRVMMSALDALAAGPIRATPNTMLFNLTGQPAMSVPTSVSDEGLPIGTQWVAPFGDEATLFQLAAQLEEALGWDARRPEWLDSAMTS